MIYKPFTLTLENVKVGDVYYQVDRNGSLQAKLVVTRVIGPDTVVFDWEAVVDFDSMKKGTKIPDSTYRLPLNVYWFCKASKPTIFVSSRNE